MTRSSPLLFPHSHSLRSWFLLVAPLHRMLDSEKTSTRNSISSSPKATTTGFAHPAIVNNNLTSRSRYLMAMISPRSGNYDRLEGGMGPSRVGGTKRFAWKKFAVGAALLVGVVWLFGPRAHTFSWRENGNAKLEVEGKFHCLFL